MSQRLTLSATLREKTGKNANRKLRAASKTPAVFYQAGGESTPIAVSESALLKLYNQCGRTSLFDLEIEGDGKKSSHTCLVWDVEYYPTKQRFQHVDFLGVDMDKELKVRIPLEFTGVAKGTKLGGKLEVYREQIYIYSKPGTLPKKITMDISNLDVGQGLRILDITMPEGVRPHYDTNYAILFVTIPGSAKAEDEEK